MADHIELVPSENTRDSNLPLSKRRHSVRKRDANGQIEWSKRPYANRSNAKRSVTGDHSLDNLEIRILDYDGSVIKTDRPGSW
jgi:hypothetical protein